MPPTSSAGRSWLRRLGERSSWAITRLAIPDHLLGQLSPIVAMATVAAATSTLRVSGFVLNNDLRHPAVLAQELASIDVLSGGRVDVAIGAGWNKPEYDAIGIGFDPAPVRQARLAESIAVLKGLFSGSAVQLRRRALHDHRLHRPRRSRCSGRTRRSSSAAVAGARLPWPAREADIVGLAPRVRPNGMVDAASLTLAGAREKIDWVRQAAGDRFDALEFNTYPTRPVVITDDLRGEVRQAIDRLRSRTGVELTEQEVLDRRSCSSDRWTGWWRSSCNCGKNSASPRSCSAMSANWSRCWSGCPAADRAHSVAGCGGWIGAGRLRRLRRHQSAAGTPGIASTTRNGSR